MTRVHGSTASAMTIRGRPLRLTRSSSSVLPTSSSVRVNGRRAMMTSVVRAYDSKERETATPQQATTPPYPNLFNMLLQKAATRLDRGETHCLHCQGSGIIICHTCQGAGVVAPEKVKVNMLRRAGSALKQQLSRLMHEEGQAFDFQITNRCRMCHGTGGETCSHCEGTGRRGRKQRPS